MASRSNLRPFDPDKLGIPVYDAPRERRLLMKMVARYTHLVSVCYQPQTALHDSFQKIYTSRDKVSIDIGADAFIKMFAKAIEDALEIVERVSDFCLTPLFGKKAETIDEVANDTDPLHVMMELSKKPSKRNAKERRIHAELLRNTVAAMQILKLELIAPQDQMSANLREMKRIANEELFEKDLKPVHVTMELDPDKKYRAKGDTCRIFLDVLQFHTHVKELTDAKKVFFAEADFLCRVLKGDDRRFLVRSQNRRKRRLSKFIKVNRGRDVGDVIGVKWTLVGVMPLQGGVIRPATMEDVQAFIEYTRRMYWCGRLEERPDRSPPNPETSKHYAAKKIVGVFHYEVQGMPRLMRAEQIATTFEIAINEQYSRGDDNHELYACRRALQHVVPELFGHIAGFMAELKAKRRQLEAEWLRRLPSINEPGRDFYTVDAEAAYNRLEALLEDLLEGEGDAAFKESITVLRKHPRLKGVFKPLFLQALKETSLTT